MFTAVIGFSGFGFFGKDSCAAKGAFAAGFLNDSFGVLASGISRAGKEFTVADMVAVLQEEYEVDEETATADLTELTQQWIAAGLAQE